MSQTKREIRALLEAAGIGPRKRFGQHFLIDRNLMEKLVAAASLRDTDVVLEVGAGTGSLTEELLKRAGHVVAVEIDPGLQRICLEYLGGSERFTLMNMDVLARKTTIAPQVLAKLAACQERLGGRIVMVANLPYQVATPLVSELLLGELKIGLMCFTVQAEVGERILAPPGTKKYGPVSVFVQALTTAERIARVPPAVFWPKPKVESVMLRLEMNSEQNLSPPVRERLRTTVHHCFHYRRKMMKYSLRTMMDEKLYEVVAADGRWILSDRPEQITVKQWVELSRFLEEAT